MDKNLRINEINASATISIMASFGKRQIELPADYADLTTGEVQELVNRFDNKFLPLDSILKEWQDRLKEVNFKGSISKLDLLVVDGDSVFIWEGVKIYKYTLSTGKTIQVVCPIIHEGQKYNRRRGVRITIDKVMDVEQDSNVFSVIVRDLSYCGVSFVEPMETTQLDPSKPFTLHLIEDSEEGENLVGLFTGKISNQQEIDQGILNGCELASEHASALQKYIAIKQLEQIRGKKYGKAITRTTSGEYWREELGDRFKSSMKRR